MLHFTEIFCFCQVIFERNYTNAHNYCAFPQIVENQNPNRKPPKRKGFTKPRSRTKSSTRVNRGAKYGKKSKKSWYYSSLAKTSFLLRRTLRQPQRPCAGRRIYFPHRRFFPPESDTREAQNDTSP